MAALERDLVVYSNGPSILRRRLGQLEVIEDRLLRIFVHDPLVADLLRDAPLTAIERGDDLLDGHAGTLPA